MSDERSAAYEAKIFNGKLTWSAYGKRYEKPGIFVEVDTPSGAVDEKTPEEKLNTYRVAILLGLRICPFPTEGSNWRFLVSPPDEFNEDGTPVSFTSESDAKKLVESINEGLATLSTIAQRLRSNS